jgi:hypothetical protein
MIVYRVGCAAILLCCLWVPAASAGCRVDDDDFTTTDGGFMDLSSGLVWSPDLRALGTNQLPQSTVNIYNLCDNYLNDATAGGGFTDWRPPTLGEVEEALANGLNSHLDYFLNGSGDDGVYYYTSCTQKVRGLPNAIAVRHSDGDVRLGYVAFGYLVCVRGLPSDNDCPGNGKGGDKKKRTAALSSAATGATQLLPLCLDAIACGAKRRIW